MLMGQVPKQELLMQNGLREYRAVVHAMKTGNIGLMDDALAKVELIFGSLPHFVNSSTSFSSSDLEHI